MARMGGDCARSFEKALIEFGVNQEKPEARRSLFGSMACNERQGRPEWGPDVGKGTRFSPFQERALPPFSPCLARALRGSRVAALRKMGSSQLARRGRS